MLSCLRSRTTGDAEPQGSRSFGESFRPAEKSVGEALLGSRISAAKWNIETPAFAASVVSCRKKPKETNGAIVSQMEQISRVIGIVCYQCPGAVDASGPMISLPVVLPCALQSTFSVPPPVCTEIRAFPVQLFNSPSTHYCPGRWRPTYRGRLAKQALFVETHISPSTLHSLPLFSAGSHLILAQSTRVRTVARHSSQKRVALGTTWPAKGFLSSHTQCLNTSSWTSWETKSLWPPHEGSFPQGSMKPNFSRDTHVFATQISKKLHA